MAIFPDDQQEALDFVALRDGGISLYRRTDLLAEDIAWLERAGYRIVRLECEQWRSEDDMHASLVSAFNFPDYYGMNLNALDEVMAEIDVPQVGGTAIVLLSYDQFANVADGSRAGSHYYSAEVLLDILSRASHEFLLTGRRLLTLVQSNDPQLHFKELGGHAPRWNWREWLDKDRGL